jgi:hypothetical protein
MVADLEVIAEIAGGPQRERRKNERREPHASPDPVDKLSSIGPTR